MRLGVFLAVAYAPYQCVAFLPAGRVCAPAHARGGWYRAVSIVERRLDLKNSGEYDLLGGAGGKKGGKPKDEYDLLGDKAAEGVPVLEEDPKDVLLAEMVFSPMDVRELVFQRLDECNEEFVEFLEAKISASSDLDERQALRSLVEIIDGVKTAVEKKKAEEAAMLEQRKREDIEEEARVRAQVEEARRRAKEQEQQEKHREQMEAVASSPAAASLPLDGQSSVSSMGSEQSYTQLLEAFLGLDDSDQGYVRQVVDANYERCTVEFLDLLVSRMSDPATPPATASKLQALSGHIQSILQERMGRAAERLQAVAKAGSVEAMVDKIGQLMEQGAIDEPFVLLLETNIEQADRAGARPAAEVFRKLLAAAREALDEKLSPARRLIRRLLRVDDAEQRKEMLHAAFRPKAQALLADGSKTAAEPEVPPPEFIDELKALIKNFGNIQADGFGDKLRAMVDEAEEVSVSIYGQPMTIKEQQDYMWKKGTMSVFELEQMEQKATQSGDMMPWQNDKYDTMLPPGFNPDGTRTIGGNRKDSF